MRTPAQIEASRLNGTKSRGPVTPEGKRNSARYSTRNGLIAKSLALHAEDPNQFRDLLNEFCDEFKPGTLAERLHVQAMATAIWRQFRLRCAEKVTVDLQADIESDNLPAYEHAGVALTSVALRSLFDTSRGFESLNRQESRLERQYHLQMRQLFALQDRRGFRPTPGPNSKNDAPRSEAPHPAATETESPEVPLDDQPSDSAMDENSSDFLGMLPSPPTAKRVENQSFFRLDPSNLLKIKDRAQVQHTEPGPAQRQERTREDRQEKRQEDRQEEEQDNASACSTGGSP